MQGIIKIGTALITKGFKEGVKKLKKDMVDLDEELTEKIENTGSKFGDAIKSFGDKFMSKLEKRLDKINGVVGTLGTSFIKLGISVVNFGVKLGGILGGAGVIFAIVSAITILVQALKKADLKLDELKANFGYVGFVASRIFVNLLSPAIDKTAKGLENMSNKVNGLAGALYKVVVYIGYILSKWTGRNLFEGTSTQDYAKHMKEAQESAKKTEKSTKQIKKDLMGFDEVNKLSDNTSASGTSSGTSGKITMPTLPNIDDIEIPGWVKWIADHKDTIIKVAETLLGLFLFNKVISWLRPVGEFFGLFTGKDLIKGIKNVGTTLKDKVGGALKGLFTTSNPLFTGASGVGIGVLASLPIIIATIDNLLKGNIEHRKQLNRLAERGLEIAEEDAKEERTIEETQDFLNYKREQGYKVLEQSHKLGSKITGTTKEQLKNAEAVAKEDKLYIDQQMEKFRKGELTKEQQQNLVELIRTQKDYAYDVTDELENQKMSTDDLNELTSTYVTYLDELGVKAKEFPIPFGKAAKDTKEIKDNTEQTTQKTSGWVSKVTEVGDKISSIVKQKLPKKELEIEAKVDTKSANNTLASLLKTFVTILTPVFNTMGMGAVIKNLKSVASKMFNIKLASGGIINNPGRGVALGTNIIGGERGSEAVIPLNDETMERLGSAIAKHMNINLTNVNQMNGRTISRELKTIMNENEFTYNG